MVHKWIKVDEYHMRFGDTQWTITYAVNAAFPYGLYFNAEHKGNFKALPEAIAKYDELSNYA